MYDVVVTFVGKGVGDPLEADPDTVARDLFEGIISAWTAERVYKVVIDPDSPIGEALAEETARLRDAEREARRARGRSWEDFSADWAELSPPEEILFAFGSWPAGEVVQPVMRM